MKNFEDAITRINVLEAENLNLKNKLKEALWKLNSTSVEGDKKVTDMRVGEDIRMRKMETERKAAMSRFTAKLRNEAKKYREARKDG